MPHCTGTSARNSRGTTQTCRSSPRSRSMGCSTRRVGSGRRCSPPFRRSCHTTTSLPSASTRSFGAVRRTLTVACGGSPSISTFPRSRMRSLKSEIRRAATTSLQRPDHRRHAAEAGGVLRDPPGIRPGTYPLRDQLPPPGLRRLVGEDQAVLAGGVHGVAGLRVAGPRREGTPRLHGVETVLRGPSCQVIGGPAPRRGHRVILALFFGSVNHQSPCPASHSKSGCITQSTTHFPSSWVKQTIPALRNLTTSISGFPVSRRLTKRLR